MLVLPIRRLLELQISYLSILFPQMVLLLEIFFELTSFKGWIFIRKIWLNEKTDRHRFWHNLYDLQSPPGPWQSREPAPMPNATFDIVFSQQFYIKLLHFGFNWNHSLFFENFYFKIIILSHHLLALARWQKPLDEVHDGFLRRRPFFHRQKFTKYWLTIEFKRRHLTTYKLSRKVDG